MNDNGDATKIWSTYSFIQEESVSGQVVCAQETPQYTDGTLKKIHIHILGKG